GRAGGGRVPPPESVIGARVHRDTMRKILGRATLLLLLGSAPLHAQEGGLLEIDTGLMIWTVLIFLIVLGVLYKAAYPHILGAVEAREARISELLASAERD